MIIDTHHHLWNYKNEDFPWIEDSMDILKQNFLLPELEAELSRNHIDRTIVVQARQSISETNFLLDAAAKSSKIAGVIGWLDLRSDTLKEQLDTFKASPSFKGVRHVLQDEADDDFILAPAFQKGLSTLEQTGLIYELLILPRHLKAVTATVKNHPKLRFVLNHIAKPDIKHGHYENWATEIQALGQLPNVYVKLSGMVTETTYHQWTNTDFHLYLDTVFQSFGEDRVMFGSDWPVCLLSADYDQVLNVIESWSRKLTKLQCDKLFFKNALYCYKL